MIRMFIDDERMPPNNETDWVIVRSYDEAISWVLDNSQIPQYISFDHDLGDGLNGFDITKKLVEMAMDGVVGFPEGFDFYVHSQNPIGSTNIRTYLSQYLAMRNT